MRWLGARAGVVTIALVLASCTSTTDETAPATSITLGAASAVAQGDSIVRYGISTTPSNPWVHYRTGCDTSCGLVFAAITDTLFASALDGETVGLLVDQASTNNDSTVHTWRLRGDIVFSDGTLLDAAAAKLNIDACRHSALTGPGLAGIDDVRADGQTLTITTLAPWAKLPVHFAETPCGHMFSGAWLRSLPDLPMRSEGAPFFDQQIASLSPVGDPAAPVGLGAFVMASFDPGSGNSMLLERNGAYWRGPNGVTGESLPEADEIELVVIGDDATRRAGLETGQFDMIHTSDAVEQRTVAGLGPAIHSDAFGDVLHVIMNAVQADGNPLALVSCRRAIDRSLDRDSLAEAFDAAPSSGPFPGPSPLAEAGIDDLESTAFDPVAAMQWGARCVEDHRESVVLRLLAPTGDSRAEVVAAMIERSIGSLPDGGGVAIDVISVEPRDLGVAALLGDYDLLLWEGFAGVDPDLHFRWWFSEAAEPVGLVASNVGRIEDPALDRALVDLRRADSVERSDRAIEEIQRAFDAGVWTSWLVNVSWTIGFSDQLDAELARSTPEGVELAPIVNGVHSLHRLSERSESDN